MQTLAYLFCYPDKITLAYAATARYKLLSIRGTTVTQFE